jgi:hypothetical protein
LNIDNREILRKPTYSGVKPSQEITMAKIVIYRNNSAFQKFLAPAIASRCGELETKVFPEGTASEEIAKWFKQNRESLLEKEVVADKTCRNATGIDWGRVENVFNEVAVLGLTKATVEETIAEVVRHLLKKEVPKEVFVIQKHMEDHDLFGSLAQMNRGQAAQADAQKLRKILEAVIGKPVTVVDKSIPEENMESLWSGPAERGMWVFFDRHDDLTRALSREWKKVGWFRVPVESLIEDAVDFGIPLDAGAYSHAIREKVAAW